MKRIDAHQHFWIYNQNDYVWMGEEHGALRRDFTPRDLAPLLDAIEFDGSVAVQARQMVKETEWLLELADANERVMGVVGWIDLRLEDVQDQIDRFAPHPKLCGLRHIVHDEPDDDFMLRDDFRRGLALLEPAGLTYDFLLFPKHVSRALIIADEFPNQPFVVDHIAKPFIRDGVITPWDGEMRELAKRENVMCKLSGMVTEAAPEWIPSDFVPYLDVMMEAFGPTRLMIGSDWPVSTIAGEYPAVMQIVLDYITRLSESEQAAISGDTSARFYGIAD